MTRVWVAVTMLLCTMACGALDQIKRPHIVFILADDLGYNDIGYNARRHDSATITPFLDELAEKGIRLENYYAQAKCSPSRSQLLSGRYQIHTGLQHEIISILQHGLPLDNKIIPEQLRHCGYDTHMVGKWHLGMHKWEYTPMYRGFNSFSGLLNAGSDHFTHEKMNAVDMWKNKRPTDEYRGVYSTHLYTDRSIEAIRNANQSKPFFLYLSYQAVHSPMQVPSQYLKPFQHIKDRTRRIYAGMLLALDESVRNVSRELERAGMLNDTIFIFSSDNGGAPNYGGNNWPLRGGKVSLYEGGVKVAGFVSGRPIGISNVKSYNLMHISDWLPTILNVTNCRMMKDTPPLDGYNQWPSILQKQSSPRTEILHGMDRIKSYKSGLNVQGFDIGNRAGLRVGPWKILTGRTMESHWIPPPESEHTTLFASRAKRLIQLYHIETDPFERHDISSQYPDVVNRLVKKLAAYKKESSPIWYPEHLPSGRPTELKRKFWGPWVFDTEAQAIRARRLFY